MSLCHVSYQHILTVIQDPNDDSKWMNSALTYSPQGELIHKYDKLHPCVVSLGDGMEVDERGSCSSGSPSQKGLQPLEVKAKSGETWKIGIAICYDIRFPQFATYHRNNGCHAIVYATAWFPYTRTHWDPLLSARAIDSQAYIIAPVQYGDHDEERSSLGAGAILDPWGNKMVSLPALHHDVPAKGDGLLSALATKNEQSVYCSTGGSSEKLEDFEDCWIGYGVLKMEEVTALRKDLPVWDFLRNDVY